MGDVFKKGIEGWVMNAVEKKKSFILWIDKQKPNTRKNKQNEW